jgi:diacylglycerol O-acyltransferase / wax synthase
MNVALVDLGSLMLHAGRHSTVLPNMGLVLRFPEPLTDHELQAEAERLASLPFGLGRRLTGPRVPGARPHWVVASEPPPVRVRPPRRTARELGMWLADELSVRHDPHRGAGWRMAATTDASGAMIVAITLNHLFGTGRDIATSVYGGELLADAAPAESGGLTAAGNGNGYGIGAELRDSADRLRRGAAGVGRLARDAVVSSIRLRPHGDVTDLARPLRALTDRDRSRGRPSARRVGALIRVDRAAWERVAADRGGNSTALQVATSANLLREARRIRGAPPERPLRIIVPVDLADRNQAPQASATVGPVMLTSAAVVLPSGDADYGDLKPVRDAVRAAVRRAVEDVRVSGRVPVAPGVIDAMRLLPDAVSSRVMFGVHAHYDGAVSNVGPLPPAMMRMGGHTATDAFLMAYPLGSDLAMGFAMHGTALALGAVADPSRLGAGPPLRDRIAVELKRWGLDATAW